MSSRDIAYYSSVFLVPAHCYWAAVGLPRPTVLHLRLTAPRFWLVGQSARHSLLRPGAPLAGAIIAKRPPGRSHRRASAGPNPRAPMRTLGFPAESNATRRLQYLWVSGFWRRTTCHSRCPAPGRKSRAVGSGHPVSGRPANAAPGQLRPHTTAHHRRRTIDRGARTKPAPMPRAAGFIQRRAHL